MYVSYGNHICCLDVTEIKNSSTFVVQGGDLNDQTEHTDGKIH